MADLIGQDTSKPLQESDIREQELKWPAFFEVTRRIGEMHESILHSSQVRYCIIRNSVNLMRIFRRLSMSSLQMI